MDAEALRKTREHYNSHANLHEDREQACTIENCKGYRFALPACLKPSTYLMPLLLRRWKLVGKAKPCPLRVSTMPSKER